MEVQAYMGETIAGLLYLVAGGWLALLARRTGQAPERLLAAMFTFSGISYILYYAPDIFRLEDARVAFSLAGRLMYAPAPILLAVFTRLAFRPEVRWATWLVVGIALLHVGGVAGSILGGDLEGFTLTNPWFAPEWLGYTLPYCWAGVEALHQYRQSRARLRLGLCGPVTSNRLLLWGIFGATQTIASLLMIPMYLEFAEPTGLSSLWDGLAGACECAAIAAVWLAFASPAFYRRWIAVNSGAAEAEAS